MKEASIALLLRIENGEPIHDSESNFHVYFPTKEITGTGFVIHGDFYDDSYYDKLAEKILKASRESSPTTEEPDRIIRKPTLAGDFLAKDFIRKFIKRRNK